MAVWTHLEVTWQFLVHKIDLSISDQSFSLSTYVLYQYKEAIEVHFNIIENSKVLEAAEAVGKTSNIDF